MVTVDGGVVTSGYAQVGNTTTTDSNGTTTLIWPQYPAKRCTCDICTHCGGVKLVAYPYRSIWSDGYTVTCEAH